MDSYIVRIYRRTGEPSELAGQVERAGTELKEIFHNSGELMRVLMSEGSIQPAEGASTQMQYEIIR
jgi:hypothetical protein